MRPDFHLRQEYGIQRAPFDEYEVTLELRPRHTNGDRNKVVTPAVLKLMDDIGKLLEAFEREGDQ